ARQTGATPAEGTEDNIDIDELVESAETGAAETAVQEDSVSETQAEAAGEAETQPGTQP
ncbi:ABC transporter, partial [Neisseria meningitidis]